MLATRHIRFSSPPRGVLTAQPISMSYCYASGRCRYLSARGNVLAVVRREHQNAKPAPTASPRPEICFGKSFHAQNRQALPAAFGGCCRPVLRPSGSASRAGCAASFRGCVPLCGHPCSHGSRSEEVQDFDAQRHRQRAANGAGFVAAATLPGHRRDGAGVAVSAFLIDPGTTRGAVRPGNRPRHHGCAVVDAERSPLGLGTTLSRARGLF